MSVAEGRVRGNKSTTLIVCSTPNMRGIHNYALGLQKRLCDSVVVGPNKGRFFVYWELVGILGRFLDIWKSGALIFANSRISPLIWPCLARKYVGVVIHDLMDTTMQRGYNAEGEDLLGKGRRKINTWLIVQSLKRADFVIANSSTTKVELVREGIVMGKQVYIVNPAPSFGGLVRTRHESESLKQCKSGGILILGVTGSSENKCLDDYFRMIDAIVMKRRIDICLVLVGVDELGLSREAREIYRRNENTVVLKKGVSKSYLVSLYLSCDVFVSLSSDEGYGIPVADAIGFGIPVIARNIPAFREISEDITNVSPVSLCDDYEDCCVLVEKYLASGFLDTFGMHEEKKASRIENYMVHKERYEKRASQTLNEIERYGSTS